MGKLKVTQVGNSLAVIFPRELTARLKVGKGDQLAYTETANGIEVSAYDPDFEHKLEAARRVSRRYRNALKELAK
jgi:putative addiction module antidote